MKTREQYVGWYAVDSSQDDFFKPNSESEGPHATFEDAKSHASADQIVRYLHVDGYLYVDEPDNDAD